MRFRHTRGHRSHADLGHQLHRNTGARVHVLQIVDQLRQILDRVDVVVRRRRDQAHARYRMAHPRNRFVHLVSRQLAALAGLGALRHLDLQFVGVDQVIRRDAEPRARHLFDRAAPRRAVTRLVFSAFARIALAPDTVHRDGQRLVRLLGDGAVAHRPGGESFDDLLRRFHILQRDRLRRGLELEQTAQRAKLSRLRVDQVGVFLEGGEALRAHRMLQLLYGQRIIQVILAARAELIIARHRQFGIELGLRRERVLVLENRLLREHFQPYALDAAGGAGEVFVHQALAQSDGLEYLRAAIALQRRDAHLAEGLQQSFVDALHVIGHRLLVGADRLQRQVRIDRARPVADQQREVHHLARLAALDDQRHLRARLFAHQVIVYRRHRQQAGNGRIFLIHPAIRENQQRVAGLNRQRSAPAQLGQRALQALGAIFHREQHGQRGRQEIALADPPQSFPGRDWSESDAAASACGSAAASRRECCAPCRCSWSATSPSLRGSGRSADW